MVVVELPLKVGRTGRSREAALKLVGGVEAVAAAVSGDARASLGLALSECGPPLQGDVLSVGRPRFVVALRVSKKRQRVVEAEIVGRARQRCVFWGAPADFCGVPASHRRERKGAYGLKEWPDGKKSSLAAQRVRAGDPAPTKATPTALLLASALEDEPRLKAGIEKARELLARRPVWRRQRLAQELSDDLNSTELTSVLPVVAYELLGGPWRRTWVRFGHTPSQDPRSRFLQVIEHKKDHQDDPPAGAAAAAGAAQAAQAKTTTTTKKHATFVQLCDLDHRDAQDAVLEAPRRHVCESSQQGWFHKAFFDDTLTPLLAKPPTAKDQESLSWREFLDVAAVADLQTGLLDDDDDDHQGDPNGGKERRREEESPPATTNVDDQPHQPPAVEQSSPGALPIARGQPNTAFTLLEDDDDDDDDDDEDDEDD